MAIKDRDLYAIAIAAEKCANAMGDGIEADCSALSKLISTFHEHIAAIVDRYEYAAADHVITAGCAMADGVYLDMRTAIEEEQYAPRQTRQYSTLYAVNGHVVG